MNPFSLLSRHTHTRIKNAKVYSRPHGNMTNLPYGFRERVIGSLHIIFTLKSEREVPDQDNGVDEGLLSQRMTLYMTGLRFVSLNGKSFASSC